MRHCDLNVAAFWVLFMREECLIAVYAFNCCSPAKRRTSNGTIFGLNGCCRLLGEKNGTQLLLLMMRKFHKYYMTKVKTSVQIGVDDSHGKIYCASCDLQCFSVSNCGHRDLRAVYCLADKRKHGQMNRKIRNPHEPKNNAAFCSKRKTSKVATNNKRRSKTKSWVVGHKGTRACPKAYYYKLLTEFFIRLDQKSLTMTYAHY